MKLEYDPIGDIAYIAIREGEVHRTEDVSGGRQYDRGIDYDERGEIIGYEFMNATRGLDVRGLPHAEQLVTFLKGVALLTRPGRMRPQGCPPAMTDATIVAPLDTGPEPMNPEELRAFRAKHGLTRVQVAALLNVALGTIRNWEQGVRRMSAPEGMLLRRVTQAEIVRVKREHPPKHPAALPDQQSDPGGA